MGRGPGLKRLSRADLLSYRPMNVWRRLDGALLAALSGYFVLTVLLTYPLVLHFSTHVIGSNVDEGAFVWNLWWVRHALLDQHVSPYFTDWIFYPVGLSLVFYTLAPINAIVSLPVQLVFDPIVAENAVTWASFTFSGLGMFLLARTVLQTDFALSAAAGTSFANLASDPRRVNAAAFAGGIVYAFPASRFVYASLGQANLTSTAWLPFFALAVVRLIQTARTGLSLRTAAGFGALSGLALAFATYSELTYATFLALLTGLLLASAIFSAKKSSRKFWTALVLGMAAQLTVAAIALLPLLSAALSEARAGGTDVLRAPIADSERFSADLLSFITPTGLHPIFGEVGRTWASRFTDIPIVYLGFSVAALAASGAWIGRRRLWAWWLGAAAFAVLTLGPVLHVNGKSEFDLDGLALRPGLPFLALSQIPLFNANRVPNRFSIMLTLCLGVLVASALFWLGGLIARRTQRGWPALALCGGATALILFEHVSLPLPLTEAAPPPIYHRIAAEQGDFTVLLLPLGWRNSYGIQGQEKTILQSYQTLHQKRLLGGNTSRNSAFKFEYYRRLPIVSHLIAIEEGKPIPPDAETADRAAAPSLLSFFDIRYVVVHRAYVEPAAEAYLKRVLTLEPISDENGVAAYRVPPNQGMAGNHYDVGTPAAAPVLGEGWAGDEAGAGVASLSWATERQATLYSPAGAAPRQLRMRVLPFSYPSAPAQTVRAQMDGLELGTQTLTVAWQDLVFDLPPSASGVHRFTLTFAYAASPSVVLGTPDQRTLAIACDFVEFAP